MGMAATFSASDGCLPVDQVLGNAYLTVREVYKNLQKITYVADNLPNMMPKDIELREDPTSMFLQWRYVEVAGDGVWTNLVALADITGGTPELRLNTSGLLQWKYVTEDDTQWRNLWDSSELTAQVALNTAAVAANAVDIAAANAIVAQVKAEADANSVALAGYQDQMLSAVGAGLIGYGTDKLSDLLGLGIGHVVDSIAALTACDVTKYGRFFATGFYSAGDGGGGDYIYNPTSTATPIPGLIITPASGVGRIMLVIKGEVSALQFGLKADAGTTDNSVCLLAIRNWIAAAAVKNRVYFPAGIYGYSQSPNWAIQNAHIVAQGEVHFKYNGTGRAIVIDGTGAPNLGIYNMTMTGFTVDSIAGAQDGAYIYYAHHSRFNIKVRGAGTAYAGIKTGFCVCTHFDNCEVSPNADGGWYGNAKPLYGFWITGPSPVLQTSYCTFTNCIGETCNTTNGAGLFIECSLGNIFNGGTFEGCYTGVLTANAAAGCVSNKFFGVDMEGNVFQDVYDQSFMNEYWSCDTNLLFNIIGNSYRVQVFGGSHQSISVATGASGTGFMRCMWNRNGGGSFIDGSGVARGLSTCYDHTNNRPGPFTQGAVAVGASPFVYTNTSGDDQVILVSGNSTTQLMKLRAGVGNVASLTNGEFLLCPGDQLQFVYPGAAPSLWRYSR